MGKILNVFLTNLRGLHFSSHKNILLRPCECCNHFFSIQAAMKNNVPLTGDGGSSLICLTFFSFALFLLFFFFFVFVVILSFVVSNSSFSDFVPLSLPVTTERSSLLLTSLSIFSTRFPFFFPTTVVAVGDSSFIILSSITDTASIENDRRHYTDF